MKWIKNVSFLKRLEAVGFLLTLIGLIVKFSVTDIQISTFSKADRCIESYQKQFLSYSLEQITAVVSPDYIKTKEGYITLANFLMAGTSYYLDALELAKTRRDGVISGLMNEGQSICDNKTLILFRNHCNEVINEYKDIVYKQHDDLSFKIKWSNRVFASFTLIGSFIIFFAKWNLAKY
ncbi:MAG: hypothetical protein HXX16_09295 [Bacteroidales bacterium]|nr:hypothetical protein [Bacteroidales bacterium]